MTDKKLICRLHCSDSKIAPTHIDIFTKNLSAEAYNEIREIRHKYNILDLDPMRGMACDGYTLGWRLYDESNNLCGRSPYL